MGVKVEEYIFPIWYSLLCIYLFCFLFLFLLLFFLFFVNFLVFLLG